MYRQEDGLKIIQLKVGNNVFSSVISTLRKLIDLKTVLFYCMVRHLDKVSTNRTQYEII